MRREQTFQEVSEEMSPVEPEESPTGDSAAEDMYLPNRPQPANADGTARPAGGLWPSGREWPSEWTADYLVELGVRRRDAAERVLAMVRSASKENNPWMPWFLRERIQLDLVEMEKSRREQLPNDRVYVAWRDLLAGLPVLAEWLSAPEALELHRLVARKQPFRKGATLKSGSAVGKLAGTVKSLPGNAAGGARLLYVKRSYGSAARPLVAAMRQRVEEAAVNADVYLYTEDLPGPYNTLVELLDRLPMVDSAQIWGKSRQHFYPLSQVFTGIFRFQPPPVAQEQAA